MLRKEVEERLQQRRFVVAEQCADRASACRRRLAAAVPIRDGIEVIQHPVDRRHLRVVGPRRRQPVRRLGGVEEVSLVRQLVGEVAADDHRAQVRAVHLVREQR